MATPHVNFPAPIQNGALERQKNKCASCGVKISGLGKSGAGEHEFEEGVHAHHVIPHKLGGPITQDNCVILCVSCHRSAHQGSRWADVSIYEDLKKLPMPLKIARIAALYPHYWG